MIKINRAPMHLGMFSIAAIGVVMIASTHCYTTESHYQRYYRNEDRQQALPRNNPEPRPESRNDPTINDAITSELQSLAAARLPSSSPPPALHLDYSPIDEERLNLSRVLAVQFVLGKVLRALGPKFENQLPSAPTQESLGTLDTTLSVQRSTCPSKYTRCSSSTFYPSCQIPRSTEPYMWQNRFTMFFNISHELAHIERKHMMNATLRLYKNVSIPLAVPILLRIRVHAYTSPLSRSKELSAVVGSKRVWSDYVGWVMINVNRAFRRIRNGRRNHGFKISVKNEKNEPWNIPKHFIRMDCQASHESLTPLPFEIQLANPAHKYPALNIRYGKVWMEDARITNTTTTGTYRNSSSVPLYLEQDYLPHHRTSHNNTNISLDELVNPRLYGRMQAEQTPEVPEENESLYNTEIFEYYGPAYDHLPPSGVDRNISSTSLNIYDNEWDRTINNNSSADNNDTTQDSELPNYRFSRRYFERQHNSERQHNRNIRRHRSHSRRVWSRQADQYQASHAYPNQAADPYQASHSYLNQGDQYQRSHSHLNPQSSLRPMSRHSPVQTSSISEQPLQAMAIPQQPLQPLTIIPQQPPTIPQQPLIIPQQPLIIGNQSSSVPDQSHQAISSEMHRGPNVPHHQWPQSSYLHTKKVLPTSNQRQSRLLHRQDRLSKLL